MERHTVPARDLDRARHHHARAGRGHLEHLLVADPSAACSASGTRRGSAVKTPSTSVKISHAPPERGGERDRGRVRPAAAERRHLVLRRHALEAGDEHDLLAVERLVDALRAHLDDLRLAVHGVGDDPRLRAGERDRLVAEVVEGHRAERVRDALADRDEHVVLARLRVRRDLVGEPDQLVGRVAHRREHADDPVAALARGDEAARDVLDLLRVADGGAAELHDDEIAAARLRVGGELRDLLVVRDGHAKSVGLHLAAAGRARGRA